MNHARKIVLLTAVLAILAVPALAADPNPFDTNVCWPIAFTYAYSWWCSGSYGFTTLHLYQNRTWTTDEGFTGAWSFDRATRTLTVDYGSQGCCPIYQWRFTSRTHAEGTMQCMCGSGNGCSYLDYAGCFAAPETGKVPGAGASSANPN